jgi:hypothetical protein
LHGVTDPCLQNVPGHRSYVSGLRAKIQRGDLVAAGTRLTPAVLVEVLVVNEAVTTRDLDLLDDPAWLAWQEAHWWKT